MGFSDRETKKLFALAIAVATGLALGVLGIAAGLWWLFT